MSICLVPWFSYPTHFDTIIFHSIIVVIFSKILCWRGRGSNHLFQEIANESNRIQPGIASCGIWIGLEIAKRFSNSTSLEYIVKFKTLVYPNTPAVPKIRQTLRPWQNIQPYSDYPRNPMVKNSGNLRIEIASKEIGGISHRGGNEGWQGMAVPSQ